jgi:hypothetical protein
MKKISILFITLLFANISCISTKTAPFDSYSYQKTTELKVSISVLMDKSTEPYIVYHEKVNALLLEIEKVKEYEKGKPNNAITIAMWEMLTDTEGNLLTGYFVFWKTNQMVSFSFKKEAKQQILEALDLMIQYEMKKDKTTENELLKILSTK